MWFCFVFFWEGLSKTRSFHTHRQVPDWPYFYLASHRKRRGTFRLSTHKGTFGCIKKDSLSDWQDGSVCKAACCQSWKLEFHSYEPYNGRREPTSANCRTFLYIYLCLYIHTWACIYMSGHACGGQKINFVDGVYSHLPLCGFKRSNSSHPVFNVKPYHCTNSSFLIIKRNKLLICDLLHLTTFNNIFSSCLSQHFNTVSHVSQAGFELAT